MSGEGGAVPAIITWADVPAQTWRNGGGLTRELWAWPNAADWQLRLSVAEVQRSGPFSVFPGVERWFVVLEGAGVELVWPERRLRLHTGGPACCFDGGDAPHCRLIDGVTRDLNLMLRGATGGLWPARAGEDWVPAHAQAALFTLEALQLQAEGAALIAVPAMTLCWWLQAPARLHILPPPDTSAAPGAAPAGWWIGANPTRPEPP